MELCVTSLRYTDSFALWWGPTIHRTGFSEGEVRNILNPFCSRALITKKIKEAYKKFGKVSMGTGGAPAAVELAADFYADNTAPGLSLSQGPDNCALHAARNANWPLYNRSYCESQHNMSIGQVAQRCDYTKARAKKLHISGQSLDTYVLSAEAGHQVFVAQYVSLRSVFRVRIYVFELECL